MSQTLAGNRAERFMPDWIVSGVIRISLVPGLWFWGRANADAWPQAAPEFVRAVEVWSLPFLSAHTFAPYLVWGAQLAAVLLAVGFLTRLVGLALLAMCAVFAWWIAPYAWTSVAVLAALALYLFARGGGALSIDGAIAATTR
jgi:putative oxidoreductase